MFELPIKLTEEEQSINNIEAIYPLIEEAFKIKDVLTFLEIKSEDDLSIANAKAVDAKKIIKQVEAKRKEFTAPIDKQKKTIMDLEKRILKPIMDGVEDITNRIISFQEEIEKKKREEIKKLEQSKEKITDYKQELKELEIKIYNSIESKKDLESLQSVATKAISNKEGNAALQLLVKKSNSADILELAELLTERVKRFGKAKKEWIVGIGKTDLIALRKQLEEEMNGAELITTNAEVVTLSSDIKTIKQAKGVASIRKSIKFELSDIKMVPKAFTKLVVDEEKVNAWIKEYEDKEKLYDKIEEAPDRVIVGLNFRVEKSHVGR
jgi:hypothetical protein